MRAIGWLGVVVAMLALPLTGCGFQLRGQAQLPPELQVTYVQTRQEVGVPPGAVSRKLALLLADNGVTVTRDPAQATATLTVLREGVGRRTITADRFDVKRLYTLVYDVAYQVTLADGRTLIPAEGFSVNRTLVFDEDRILGFEAAQESLADSMADDLAWQIIRRLQMAAGS